MCGSDHKLTSKHQGNLGANLFLLILVQLDPNENLDKKVYSQYNPCKVKTMMRNLQILAFDLI